MSNLRIGKVTEGDMKANSYIRSDEEVGRITAELGRAACIEFYTYRKTSGELVVNVVWENLTFYQQKLWCRVALAVLDEMEKHA